jgi:thermitase
MKREYVSRRRRIQVEELDGVVAVRLEGAQGDDEGVEEALTAAGEAWAEAAFGVRDSDWQAFRDAGWSFVPPDTAATLNLEAAVASDSPRVRTRAFRDTEGRLMLGSDRLTVRLRPELSEDEALQALGRAGLTPIRKLGFAPNLFQARVAPGTDFLDASVSLSESADFEYAEPEFIEHIPPRFTPADPDFGKQWHLVNTGQHNGRPGADLGVQAAWLVTRGAGTCIAVVDNGFDVRHPDLRDALASTSGSFHPDGSGPARFVQGLDQIPTRRHGTMCAGVAAARADNGEGGCGVANEAALTLVGCLVDQLGSQVTLARAIAYAADPRQESPAADLADGADVISCSLGPKGAPWQLTGVLQDSIHFATGQGRRGKGTPVFWATDNANVPIEQDEVCSYEKVIAVGLSTNHDLEGNSAHGSALDFLAPGVDIYSTALDGGYGTETGTSMAAPAAAGVAALVLAVNPNLRWEQVREIMRATCKKPDHVSFEPDGRNDDYGFGRVDAGRAVDAARLAGDEAGVAPHEAVVAAGSGAPARREQPGSSLVVLS